MVPIWSVLSQLPAGTAQRSARAMWRVLIWLLSSRVRIKHAAVSAVAPSPAAFQLGARVSVPGKRFVQERVEQKLQAPWHHQTHLHIT